MRIGLLHPGQMGASVGAAAKAAGTEVRWASKGRSRATRVRAEAAGFSDSGDLNSLLGASEVVLSVCPPHCAMGLAREVAEEGFTGLYVDANAVAPTTSRAIENMSSPSPADRKAIDLHPACVWRFQADHGLVVRCNWCSGREYPLTPVIHHLRRNQWSADDRRSMKGQQGRVVREGFGFLMGYEPRCLHRTPLAPADATTFQRLCPPHSTAG